MTLRVNDRVWDLSNTVGTGAALLNNTPPTAYQNFGAVCSNTDTIYYCIANRNSAVSEWEVGLGTYSVGGPSLARTTVFASSNANALVNFSSGIKDVLGVWPAAKFASLSPIIAATRSSSAATVNLSTVTDYFLALDPTANAITVNLPASPTLGLSYLIKDATGQCGTHNITIVPASGTIDGAANLVLAIPFQSVAVTYTGAQWSIN